MPQFSLNNDVRIIDFHAYAGGDVGEIDTDFGFVADDLYLVSSNFQVAIGDEQVIYCYRLQLLADFSALVKLKKNAVLVLIEVFQRTVEHALDMHRCGESSSI